MSPDSTAPGQLMAAEIAEQPQVWRRLLDEGRDRIRAAAAEIAAAQPRFVLFVARGTSDQAVSAITSTPSILLYAVRHIFVYL